MKKLLAVSMFLLASASACGGESDSTDTDASGDHADRLVLEGAEVTDFIGSDGVSDPFSLDGGFRRLGLLWDATAENAFEVRTSLDGKAWSEWKSPTVVSVEMIAHAGHVDALDLGGAGSTEEDPRAGWFQIRLVPAAATPTFLTVEGLADIPAPFDPNAAVEVEDEASDGEPTGLTEGPAGVVVRTTPIGDLRIYARADWGAKAPRCASGTMTPNRATIHHTVTPTNDSMTPQQRLRQIQAFHQVSRGWCDIGYNYLVSRDGRVWRGRGPTTVGAHVSNSNTGNVGISFMGTYTSTAPTDTQMCQSAKLLRRLHEDFSGISLNRTDVKGHRQYGGTTCPGDALYNRIDKILLKARNGCAAN
jgi:N-acetylmuramoyl-L-alanine amidase